MANFYLFFHKNETLSRRVDEDKGT